MIIGVAVDPGVDGVGGIGVGDTGVAIGVGSGLGSGVAVGVGVGIGGITVGVAVGGTGVGSGVGSGVGAVAASGVRASNSVPPGLRSPGLSCPASAPLAQVVRIPGPLVPFPPA